MSDKQVSSLQGCGKFREGDKLNSLGEVVYNSEYGIITLRGRQSSKKNLLLCGARGMEGWAGVAGDLLAVGVRACCTAHTVHAATKVLMSDAIDRHQNRCLGMVDSPVTSHLGPQVSTEDLEDCGMNS